jgi:acyl carrier protein
LDKTKLNLSSHAREILRNTEVQSESVEGTLSSWWQDMLGVSQVDLDDDFFGLGGHSLVGVRLLAKIKRAYQVELGLNVLFEARTIRELASAIRKAQ